VARLSLKQPYVRWDLARSRSLSLARTTCLESASR
jgi:hypothetical protein